MQNLGKHLLICSGVKSYQYQSGTKVDYFPMAFEMVIYVFSQLSLAITYGRFGGPYTVGRGWEEQDTLRAEVQQVHTSAALPAVYLFICFHPAWLTVTIQALALLASDLCGKESAPDTPEANAGCPSHSLWLWPPVASWCFPGVALMWPLVGTAALPTNFSKRK